ncbi:MAG TPA: GNAT family N-acetyltransferase [Baekduia sp.]|nr:GNAT family N-acetyltransferase [Baekduia sp.]
MIEVRPIAGDDELQAAMALRHDVFVVEQRVPLEEEYDGRDAEAEHLVAVRDGAVVGTCRLLREGDLLRLGRMAVAREARRQGVASRLLEEAERAARDAGTRGITLHAQVDALPLYEQAGYTAYGERFLDAGIEHLAMDKPLAAADA